jgi:hypothetical protein
MQGSPPVSGSANLSFRPKQTDAFSSTFVPAKVSVCGVEKSLFVLSRSLNGFPTPEFLAAPPSYNPTKLKGAPKLNTEVKSLIEDSVLTQPAKRIKLTKSS